MIGSALSGILLSLCFPKAGLHFLAWVALIPIFFALKKSKDIKIAALQGYLFGTIFFSINLAWLTTLSDYAGFWAVLGYLSLVLFQSLYFAAAAILIKTIFTRLPQISTLSVPLIWIFIEWIRTLTPFGVAAGGLGYTQSGNLIIVQIASLSSVYGISFFIIFINMLLVNAAENIKNPQKTGLYLLLAAISFSLVITYGQKELQNRPADKKDVPGLKISVIQGNIAQQTKLSPLSLYSSFEKHEKLSRTTRPDIIIWPETAITDYIMDNAFLLKRVRQLARETGAYLLIGSPYYDNSKKKIYNSLLAFSPSGELVGRYNKQHPVPFGEYLPFRPLLYPFLKNLNFFNYDFDGDPKPSLIEIKGKKIGVLICFESTFPSLAKDRAKMGADILLTVTNDAWFKDSSALQKHFNMGIMRAVENRKYFIQAANTGISAIIDPHGRVLQKTKIDTAEVLTFQIPPAQ